MEADWDKIKHFIKKTKDLQHIGISNITAKAIAGLFWFYMAALLGTENYGEVTYFVAIGSTAATLALIGSPTTLIWGLPRSCWEQFHSVRALYIPHQTRQTR